MFWKFSMAILIFQIDRVMSYGFGIDWGTEYHKSTILLPGEGFKMVENEISKRKTQSTISFCGNSRFFENTAQTKFTRQNCISFFHLNKFLGSSEKMENNLDMNVALSDQFSFVFPVEPTTLDNFKRTKTQRLVLENGNEAPANFIRLEELMAMMLEHEKQNANNTGKNVFNIAAFTIWDNNMSIVTRKQLLSVIRLAGIKPIGFIHENTAALTYLSMDRQADKEKETEVILLVNLGSNGLKLSLARFDKFTQIIELTKQSNLLPSVSIMNHLFYSSFSGFKVDQCLAELALNKQAEIMKKSSETLNLKTSQKRRLFNEANKAKEMLSANKEIQFIIEDFFGDSHFNIKLNRGEFEKHCKYLFDKFAELVVGFVGNTKITRIEAIGGIIRIPIIQETLKSLFNLPVGSRINGDEGAAMGAAYFAANKTSGLKLKKIIVNDGPDYEVLLKVSFPNGNSADKETLLFPSKTNYGTPKKINIKQLSSNVQIRLLVQPEDYSITYNVTNIESVLQKYSKKVVEDWKVQFVFELDFFGIPKLSKAELILKENITETINKTLPQSNSTSNVSTPKYTLETKEKTLLRTEKLVFNIIHQTYLALHDDKELFFESQNLLKAFAEKEAKEKQLAMSKNKLETFVYTLGSVLGDAQQSRFLKASEIELFTKKSGDIEIFLDQTGLELKSVDKMIFEAEKLADLLKDRKEAHEERESTWRNWLLFHKNSTILFEKLKKEKHFVEMSVLIGINQDLIKAKQKMEELHEKQRNLELFVDPVFRADLVNHKITELRNKLEKLSKMTKPKNDIKKQGKQNSPEPNQNKTEANSVNSDL